MNILYIACSCSPYHGSEDAIGWNVPLQCAISGNEVFVITREEQRVYVEKYLEDHSIPNLHFYYVDIPSVYKKIFKGPFFSVKLNIWHHEAMSVARDLCENYNIDVIHQITPIEFRSIGDYGKISNVNFVCGPIAGGQTIPRGLWRYCLSFAHIEVLRLIINYIYREWVAIKKLKYCNCLLFANAETRDFFSDRIPRTTECLLMPDVSIECRSDFAFTKETDFVKNDVVRLAVVGRLVNIKGHDLLFEALKQIPSSMKYECWIVGDGPEKQRLMKKCAQYNLENRVKFIGEVNHTEIFEVYKKSDVLIFPSFREATGTVILEAMSMGLPVVTMKKFGGALILNDDCGWFYTGKNKQKYCESLRDVLIRCINEPSELKVRGEQARLRAMQFTWQNRNKTYLDVYKSLHEG